MKKFLMLIPTGIWSFIITIFVAYLSLASDPLGSSHMHLFPGADKVVHLIMYFGCTLAYLYEYQKAKLPHHPTTSISLALTCASAIYGLLLECAQLVFTDDRSFDMLDWAADAAGAVLAFLLMHFIGYHIMRVSLTGTINKKARRRRSRK